MDTFSRLIDSFPCSKLNVLCVWPRYYSKYPPLGLLKLSAYHRLRGDMVQLVRPPEIPEFTPDVIYVTSLFTYAWEKVKEAVGYYRHLFPGKPVVLGGIYASLMPEHAQEEIKPDYIWRGIVSELEEILPDYSLVPGWKGSIVFTSRGCIRNCPFCAVPVLEPDFVCRSSVGDLINKKYNQAIFWDNNFLASPYHQEILEELINIKKAKRYFQIDFNQGLDARLITPDNAAAIASLRMSVVRLAYDSTCHRKALKRAIDMLCEAGVSKKRFVVYAMFNFEDTPDDFLSRVQDLLSWGVAVYPMRYQPIDALKKDSYVAPGWTPELLEMVADARRVLGVHGAWPSYEALKRKFLDAPDLRSALILRKPKEVVAI
ncbi:MAG: hypothetical protein HPY90_14765 [Syntrophothermus sp.]|uniref:hypothetical protein n=1 Tax=Syntrophothermus sp. TaxID=2736299 RepID=UPI00257FC0DD|nr:hypothetical protein [Syntrophothermus sp.]NSW84482.1 hypothetical protein [Syntrophothermus sp.]